MKVLIETGNYNLQLDSKLGMTMQDIELRKKQITEEILLQIQNNQKILLDSNISWDTRVIRLILSLASKYSFFFLAEKC